jgi:hypothetical protein
MTHEGVDIIGDVHGNPGRLVSLLDRLGYVRTAGRWRNRDGRKIVLVGDYVDRGQDSRTVLELVHQLCEDGVALALAGNHDTNWIAFCMRTPEGRLDPRSAWAERDGSHERAATDGRWCRPHTEKNVKQHGETLRSFDDAESYEAAVRRLLSLPLWLELPGLRVVHAAWIPAAIERLDAWAESHHLDRLGIHAGTLTEAIDHQRRRRAPDEPRWRELLDIPPDACASELPPGSSEPVALERIVKGVEIPLPGGASISHHPNDAPRRELRIRWFDAAQGRTYHEHALVRPGEASKIRDAFPHARIEAGDPPPGSCGFERLIPFSPADAYGPDERPILFGHYALYELGNPDFGRILRHNVGCVDNGGAYAHKSGGRLTAYRWDGERSLEPGRFVDVTAPDDVAA